MKQKFRKYELIVPVIVLIALFIFNKPIQLPDIKANDNTVLSKENKPTPSQYNPDSKVKLQNNSDDSSDNLITKPSELVKGATQKRYYLLNTPNDPYYGSAWYLQSINAPSAWTTTTGNSDITVANIDTGFALNHQDLIDSWRFNLAEFGDGKESDGFDNDGNGYVDDYRGWDFTTSGQGDNNPQAGTLNPSGSGTAHGTETAGLVGATSNNGLGTTAVSQNVSVLPLQVINDNGSGWTDDVASAIMYAVDQGVDVINMSLGTSGDDPIVRSAIDYAYNNNVVVVAAAGNCGNAGTGGVCTGNPTGFITFPASYNRVIAVGATTNTNSRASFSSYGQRLDIMAPGSGAIVSPTWTSNNATSAYSGTLYGTSYASPIVASSVALARSIRTTSSVDDIRALVMGGASKLSPMNGTFYNTSYGHGLIDVGKSVTIARDLNTSGEVTPGSISISSIKPEHDLGSGDLITYGCAVNDDTWCTLWLRDPVTQNERYLPYSKSSGLGWTFLGRDIGTGVWQIRTRQGSSYSEVVNLSL